MNNFNEYLLVRSLIQDGVAYFEGLKAASNKSQVLTLAVVGKTKFLKMVSECIQEEKVSTTSIQNLENKVRTLQQEINQAISCYI